MCATAQFRARHPKVADVQRIDRREGLATFRRKIRVFGRWRTVAAKAKARRAGRGGRERRRLQAGGYRLALFARAFPMLMRLSPITPSPTQRRMPLSPL